MCVTQMREMDRIRDRKTQRERKIVLESHIRQLSHTHTRTTAAVWPASSIFHQIKESDRLLFRLLVEGPWVPVNQSQQEAITPNS